MEEQNNINTTNTLNILYKHRYKFLFSFLATVATVIIGTMLMEPVFEAKSTLLVKPGREFVYNPEVGNVKPNLPFRYEEITNSEIRILTSSDLIEKVVNRMGVQQLYPDLLEFKIKLSHWKIKENAESELNNRENPFKIAVLTFKNSLSVTGIPKSNIIEVGFEHNNPQIAAEAVNELVDLFKEKHLEVFSNSNSSFFENQLALVQEKLKQSEEDLEAFKQKHGIFSYEEQKQLVLRQRMQLDLTLNTTENRIKELEEKRSFLTQQMESIPQEISLYKETSVQNDDLIDRGKTKLLELELKEKELTQQFDDSVPLIANVREQIKLVKDFLAKQESQQKETIRIGKNSLYQQLESQKIGAEGELISLIVNRDEIKKQLGELDQQMTDFDRFERKLVELNRKRITAEKNYHTYLAKFEEAKITEEMDRQKLANISVIQAGTVPLFPIRPRKQLNTILGFLFGIVAGFIVVFGAESLEKNPGLVKNNISSMKNTCQENSKTQVGRKRIKVTKYLGQIQPNKERSVLGINETNSKFNVGCKVDNEEVKHVESSQNILQNNTLNSGINKTNSKNYVKNEDDENFDHENHKNGEIKKRDKNKTNNTLKIYGKVEENSPLGSENFSKNKKSLHEYKNIFEEEDSTGNDDFELADPLSDIHGSRSNEMNKNHSEISMIYFEKNEGTKSERAFRDLQHLATKTYITNIKTLNKRLQEALKDVQVSE